MSKSLHLALLIVALAILLISCTEKKTDTPPAEQPVSGEVRGASDSDTTLAGSYFTKAEQFAKAAQYDSAIVWFEKAGRIYGKVAAQDDEPAVWKKYVECYNKIGYNLRDKGEYEKAMAYLNKVLETGLHELGDKNLTVAQSYHIIGNVHMEKGDYDNALEYLQKALTIRLQTLEDKHPSIASSYNSIGAIYFNKGDYDNTLEYFRKALTIRLQTLGENHIDVAGSYKNIGVVYQSKGDYDNALEYKQKALSIELQTLGEKHPEVASSNNALGNYYYEKGEYDNALVYHQKALAIRLQILGKKHPDVAASYHNIGNVYQNKSDNDNALEYYQKALSIWLEALGEKHPYVAASFNSIGNVYINKGDYDNALVYQHKALSIRAQNLGKKHPDVASSYINSGNIYLKKGSYDDALEYQQKALIILIQTVGEKHPNVAYGYNNIGVVYKSKADYDNALKYHQKALSTYLQSMGEKHPDVAKIYQTMGELYDKQHDFDQALRNYQKSIIALISDFDAENIAVNPTLNNISAESGLLDALTSKAEALANRSRKSEIKDLQLSVSTYVLAAELIDRMRSSYKAEGSKLFLGEQVVEAYDKAIQTALQLYDFTKEEQYTQQAFLFAEKSKSAVLQQALSESRAREFAGIPDSLLAKERQVRLDLAFYDRSLTEEKLKRDDEADSAKIALWQDKVFGLKQNYETLLQQFEKDYPDYYNLKYQVNTVTVPLVQEQILDANTALVEYFTGKDSIFIFTLTKEDFEVTAVAKDSSFEQEVEQLRQGIIERNYAHYTQPAHRLYQILLEPVIDKLSAQNLIIIPDGVLSAIPFEALLTKAVSKEGSAEDYPDLPFLVKDHAVSYVYSATLLSETLKRQRATTARDFLAFAPVYFDGVAGRTRGMDFLTANLGLDTSRSNLTTLLASKDEVNGILKIFKRNYGFFERWFGNKSRVFTEYEASEEKLKRLKLDDYRYVHFATHGFVNDSIPRLSGLVLKQDSTSADDGILHLGEVYNLSMNADLVVLSACETGLGQIAKGEGIIGLTRGFLYAGASNLLVSLWQVNDATTSNLMLNFYGQMLEGRANRKRCGKPNCA